MKKKNNRKQLMKLGVKGLLKGKKIQVKGNIMYKRLYMKKKAQLKKKKVGIVIKNIG